MKYNSKHSLHFCIGFFIFLTFSCTHEVENVPDIPNKRLVLVYMVADNNLDYFAVQDINEMEAGFPKGSDSLLVLSDNDITSKSTKFWGWISSFFDRLFSPKVETVDASRYRSASRNVGLSTGINGGRGWCGPFALAWMYRAKYNSGLDKYSYFNSWASSFGGFNTVYQIAALFGWISGTKPMTPTEMCISYLHASDWRTYITTYPNFGLDNAHTHIKWQDDPIIILKWTGELHWVVGWESTREKNWYFWDKYWFRINDNGAVGKTDGGARNTADYYRAKYRASWPFIFLKVYE